MATQSSLKEDNSTKTKAEERRKMGAREEINSSQKRHQGKTGNLRGWAERLFMEAEDESCYSMFFPMAIGETASKTQGFCIQGTDWF